MTAPRIGRFLAAVTLLAALTACTGAPPSESAAEPKPDTGESGLHEKVGLDGDATYDVYVPKDRPDAPIPAVLVLHGMPGDGPEARDYSDLDTLAESEGFLAVYPSNPDGKWDADTDGRADLDLIGEVITDLVETWNADPERVYVSGISNGADMALAVGAQLTDEVAAVAAVAPAGTGTIADVVAAAKHPTPAITFLGEFDPRIELGRDLMATWRDRADCGEPRTDADKAMTVDTYRCADDVTVVTHEIVDGGHEWFGTAEEPEPVWASSAMWEFFTETTG